MEFDLVHARSVLARTPELLDRWLRDLPDSLTRQNEGPDTWSAFDVVGHLVHGEKTDWIPRARMILEQGASEAFPPFDRFAQLEASADESLSARLDEFSALRARNLKTLDGFRLTPRELALVGRHPELGIVTLKQLLATWAVHDLSHMGQIARVLAKTHATEVGPWAEYLPILR